MLATATAATITTTQTDGNNDAYPFWLKLSLGKYQHEMLSEQALQICQTFVLVASSIVLTTHAPSSLAPATAFQAPVECFCNCTHNLEVKEHTTWWWRFCASLWVVSILLAFGLGLLCKCRQRIIVNQQPNVGGAGRGGKGSFGSNLTLNR